MRAALPLALLVPVAAAVAAAPASTSGATPAVPGGATLGLVEVTVSLLAIIALIFALAWLAARLRLTPRHGRGALAVLAEVPVGPKERVVLLKVGDGQALVGVSAEGVRALSVLAQPVLLETTVAQPTFAARLAELLGRGGAQ